MKQYISVIALLTFVFMGYGQEDIEETTMGTYEASENLKSLGSAGYGAVQTFDNRYKGIKGSVYMFQDWFPGEIFLKEKKRVSFPNLNYDVFDNYIVYKEEIGGTILEVNKKEFLKANYEGGYSADRKYDEFVDKVSFQVIFPGQVQLIKLKTNKSMSKQFPDHNSEMKKHLGNYSAKELKRKEGLVAVMKFYDSL